MNSDTICPQKGKQELAMNTEVDVMIFGGARGAGKSRLLLMKAAYYAYNDKHFHGIFFRRQTDNLKGAGGLWPEGSELYSPFKVKTNQSDLIWKFPIGSTLKCKHMEHEHSKESHRGLQYSFIGWDELDSFTETQFTFLLASLRSKARCKSFTVATTNPNPDSWILSWIDWYLDDDGLPREDRCGVIRYFVVVGSKPKFGETEKEVADKYPESVWVHNPNTGEKEYVAPKTFCFINGTVFDNPILCRDNPGYVAELNNLPELEKQRQLYGNWYIREQGASFFNRGWLKSTFEVPLGSVCVRSWDLAHTEPHEKNMYPDYTACVKMYKDTKGYYYLAGEYENTNRDSMTETEFGRFRKSFGARDVKILDQARFDGPDCTILIPQEGGAGKSQFENLAAGLTTEGFKVTGMVAGNAKGAKVKRFAPFSSAAQNGLIYIVKDTFNQDTYDLVMKELEAFDGSPSTSKRKDDFVDAASDAFLGLQKVKVPLNAGELMEALSPLSTTTSNKFTSVTNSMLR